MTPTIDKSEDKSPDPDHKRRVMVGAIGKCVHNLGVETFADWMQDLDLGYVSIKLGPAVPIQEVINKIREARPEIVGVSMRLGDLHVDKLITEFIETATFYRLHPKESGIQVKPRIDQIRASAVPSHAQRAATGTTAIPIEWLRVRLASTPATSAYIGRVPEVVAPPWHDSPAPAIPRSSSRRRAAPGVVREQHARPASE